MDRRLIGRRELLQLAGSVAGGIVAAPFVARTGFAQTRQVVVSSWGGAYQKALREAFFDPFERKTGIKVVDTSAPLVARVKAQVDSGNIEWDVIEGGTRWYPVLVSMGLIQRLDLERIGTKNILPDAVKSHGIAPTLVSMALGYNKQRVKGETPNSWSDFWNVQKFPGARSLGADVTYNLEFALLADGVAPEKLYPIDVERAFKKLAEIRPHIRVWWQQGDQPVQMLSRGEVVYASGWSSRLLAAEQQGLPIALTWGQASFSPSFFMIMKGARHADEAYEFIKFSMEPQPQAEMAKRIPVGVSNQAAAELIPAEIRATLPTAEANLKQQWPLQGEWLAENYDKINDRWQKFLLGA